jgi:hypothetical protein
MSWAWCARHTSSRLASRSLSRAIRRLGRGSDGAQQERARGSSLIVRPAGVSSGLPRYATAVLAGRDAGPWCTPPAARRATSGLDGLEGGVAYTSFLSRSEARSRVRHTAGLVPRCLLRGSPCPDPRSPANFWFLSGPAPVGNAWHLLDSGPSRAVGPPPDGGATLVDEIG